MPDTLQLTAGAGGQTATAVILTSTNNATIATLLPQSSGRLLVTGIVAGIALGNLRMTRAAKFGGTHAVIITTTGWDQGTNLATVNLLESFPKTGIATAAIGVFQFMYDHEAGAEYIIQGANSGTNQSTVTLEVSLEAPKAR